MSRSRRKTAIIGVTTAPSDKPFKVDEHRAERHAVRATIKHSLDGDDRALHSKVYGRRELPHYRHFCGDSCRLPVADRRFHMLPSKSGKTRLIESGVPGR